MSAGAHSVGIVVELDIKAAELASLANRMPVWIAETVQNGKTVEQFRRSAARRDSPSHTAIGAITTFIIDPNATPEQWVEEILGVVDEHHGFYSQSPPCDSLEIVGAQPTNPLREALAERGFVKIILNSRGFRAEKAASGER
jgi:hypothetical protein